jgi:TRAP-type mannitol/chloroaromatic compound transport system substrate-binding protein
MRNSVIAVIVGLVVGIVVGVTVISPRLELASGDGANLVKAGIQGRRPAGESIASIPLAPRPDPAEVQWKMASAYGAGLPQLGTLAKRLETQVWRVSGGTMEICFFEPGTLVPADQIFDAVGSGAIDAAFASPASLMGQSSAISLFSAVPFGPTAGEYLAWIEFGGGKALMETLYRKHNIQAVACGLLAPEASGWFRKEILVVDDLKGLRMRITGLGARVMEKLGVAAVALAGGDIFMALEAGTLDAAEFSMPAVDRALGLDRLAKHYYLPGWHQPATLFPLIVNLDQWKKLGPIQKARVETACGDNLRYGLAEGEALQFEALKDIQAKGVELHRWPRPVLKAFEHAWRDVVDEETLADSDFRRVWNSLAEFREDYAIWRELGYP